MSLGSEVIEHPELRELETPFAVVDLDAARKNAERVVAYCHSHGISWRPHVKTHKCRRIARLQLDAGATGLTVATPREAEVMSTVCDDLLLAYPVVGARKLRRLMALPERVRLTIGLDSADVAVPMSRAASHAGRRVGVLVEVDVGMGRVGVGHADDVVALAARVQELDALDYRGLMFYPGHLRAPAEQQEAGIERVSVQLEELCARLHERNLPPDVVSGGSTPTLWRSHEMRGVTEVRAGTAIFFDREGLGIDVARRDELAYSVVATVVSTAVPGQAVVDAGSKALSKEGRGADGYAELADRVDVRVKGLSEEHGVLDLAGTDWRPSVGERVRILPNHVCVSVNLQDALYGVSGVGSSAGGVVERLSLDGRGRGPFEVSS